MLAEILLDRYDRFVAHHMRTHPQPQCPELEPLCGDRLREMGTVLTFLATALTTGVEPNVCPHPTS